MRYHGRDLRKGRVSETGRVYLVTTVTANRERMFADFFIGRHIPIVLKQIDADGAAESLAWVVMPDHVHWLLALRKDDLSQVVQRFKSRTARAINPHVGRSGAVWQRGFHDHALRAEEDLQATARYLVANPLRAGLVERIGDYPLWDAIWL